MRSQVVTGSLASDMMLASCFNPQDLAFDYEKFKTTFLRTFGSARDNDFSVVFPYG